MNYLSISPPSLAGRGQGWSLKANEMSALKGRKAGLEASETSGLDSNSEAL